VRSAIANRGPATRRPARPHCDAKNL
ncbi:uncharacterized protein METZ01_LOCUS340872, partial [marine metagenome]